jgi:anaerobic magnesium-protoporphyrin IX monomethyl ester cyclase
MADVLLTHSYHLPSDAKQMRKMQPYPPLGTLYAATALRSEGISVAVCDIMFNEPISTFLEALQRHKPKLVVIYEDDFNFVTKMCLTHMRKLAHELSTIAHSKGTLVIVHGSDATDHPQEYLDSGANYLLKGEAERTLTELCTALLQTGAPGIIPGLVYVDSEKVLHDNGVLPKNPSWINLPRIGRDLIDLEPYRRAWREAHGYFSTNMVSSRGCPYRCNWCAKPISGDKFHLRAPEDVAGEIHELKELYGIEHIWFGDDVFALNHRWVEAFADAVSSYGPPIPFKIQSRADLMTETTVAALKRAGCEEIWMGVESGSQNILNAMSKGLKVSDIDIARERLRRADIRACYFLQFGYPGETWKEICETLELVRVTRPDDVGISLSYPLPGTVFFDKVQAQLGRKRNWIDSDDLCTIFVAAYTDDFYHALRSALHAEVSEWNHQASTATFTSSEKLWRRVFEMEPVSRNPHALSLQKDSTSESSQRAFLPLEELLTRTGEA